MTTPDDRLSIREIVSYSLPTFSLSAIMMTVAVYLPNYYTDQLGVSAAMLSWVFLCGRCWDAVTDPTMGHVSDHTRTRWGRRRPYFLLSALPVWLLYYFIWSPNPSLSSTGIFIHLLVTYIALFTFWTMFNIPYYSLGMELTPDYHERNRLFGGRQIFGIIGTIVGVVSPSLFTNLTGSKVAGYPWMGIVIGGMGAMFMMTTFFSVKERQETVALPTFPFFKGLGVTFRNRAFVILMLTYLTTLIGSSFIAPLAMYMAKYVVKREWVVQPLILSYMTCSLLSIPLWLFISKRIGKIKTWTAAMLLSMTGYALTYAVNEGGWLLWIICTIPTGAAAGCSMVLGPSIQADVIDSDELETGTRREGAFIGVWSFIDKAAIGIAVFLGLQGLDLIGFKPNVEQTVLVTNGIKFLISFLPTALILVAVILFQMFPITQEVHAEIRAQLEARKNGTVVDENT